MKRLIAVLLFVVFVPAAAIAGSAIDSLLPVEPNGAAGGNAPALVLNGWDVRGPRNLQGGYLTDNPESLNLDVGAGSTQNPGWLVFNFDIGKGEKFYAGQGPTNPMPLMRVDQQGIWFYSPSGRLLAHFGEQVTFYVRPRIVGVRNPWLPLWPR